MAFQTLFPSYAWSGEFFSEYIEKRLPVFPHDVDGQLRLRLQENIEMRRFIQRIQSLLHRIKWLSALTGNPFSTFLYLVKARSNKQAATHGKYRGFFFAFRGHDLSALKEVLIDDEYHFATPLLKDKKAPVIIDIGAHIGTFAIWCLSINPTSKILSIEADPETFSILNGNIQKAWISNQTCESEKKLVNRGFPKPCSGWSWNK